jgi:hypothetical protein
MDKNTAGKEKFSSISAAVTLAYAQTFRRACVFKTRLFLGQTFHNQQEFCFD